MKAVHDALALLLTTDATFATELQALNLGTLAPLNVTPGLLKGNRPFRSLGQEHFPSWILEAGDAQATANSSEGDPTGLVVGGHCQTAQVELLLALLWSQQDPDTAYAQRLALHGAVTRLLLRNPTLNETAELAWLDAMNNDRQAAHPTHVAMFRVLAEIETRRDP